MTSNNYKIFILADPLMAGHDNIYTALKQALEKFSGNTVKEASLFDFFPGFFGGLLTLIINFINKFFPDFQGIWYRWSNKTGCSLYLRSIVCSLLNALLNNYLKKYRPDAIVTTGPLATSVIDIYKKDHPKVFFACVVPEFTVHRWWLNERVNTYFFATEDVKPDLKLSAWQKAFYYGIPVADTYKEVYNRDYLRMKLGWKKDDRICLLLESGVQPLPMDDLVTSIVNNYDASIKFVAVCGKNVSMARELRKLPYAVKVFGFVESKAELMNSADYLITSATGSTIAQALTVPAKFIVYAPLPGQENANAQYLETIGAAKIAVNPYEVAKAVKEYDRADNIFLGAMGKPLASDYIAEAIMREID